jgi:hypothetical protein
MGLGTLNEDMPLDNGDEAEIDRDELGSCLSLLI